jgi:hypothetical protein
LAKRNEVRGEWRRLHKEEVYEMNSTPNIIRVINSRKMGWAGMGHVWKTREEHTGYWSGDLREGIPWKTKV